MPWRNNVAVVPSHTPPIHPFNLHRRVFAFLNDKPYTTGEVPDDPPTLDGREYDMWFVLILLGKPHYDDRKASEEQKILWCLMHHNPHSEPNDWGDFLLSKRDERTQHHRASRDEPTNHIYNNMPSVSPLGFTTMMPSQSYPPPQSHHQLQAYPPASPTLQHPTLVLPTGCPRSFGSQIMGLL